MKSIRWWFPVVIIVMAIILWWVYTQMDKSTLPAAPSPQQVKLEQLSEQQAQLALRVDELQTQLHQTNQVFTLSETSYYLNVADMQLSILKDVKTALAIMQWVQKRLIMSNAPVALQEALAADIMDLQATATPHIHYINQKIMDIQAQLPTLALRARQQISVPAEPVSTTSAWKLALHNAWGELKSLIRIQPRNTSIDYVLFDETILRETVNVELQRASIAAVIGQTELYQVSLQQAIIAFQQFFAQEQSVEQVIETLRSLTEQVIIPELPKANRALVWLQTAQQGIVQ
jgi:uncharacterized protein HemX